MTDTNRIRLDSLSKSTAIRVAIACVLLGGGFGIAHAQRMQPSNQTERRDDQDPFMPNPLTDMRVRAALRRSEQDRQENLDRASELARLGTEIKNSFQRSSTLTADDRKKLERIEKLTKKIRSAAGGSDGDFTRNVPRNLAEAINMVASATDELNKEIVATPKQVVSATVIEQTNKLLELVRSVRGND